MGVPTYILWGSGENFKAIDTVLVSNEKYLIGYLYNENNYKYLKWAHIHLNERKSVLALGSSRVSQFRENMFDTTFYNAAYAISSVDDFRPFLKSISKEKLPKYIILGLDQWMFNSAFDELNSTPSVDMWQNNFTFFPKLFPTYKMIYEDLFKRKYTFSTLKKEDPLHKIGLNAILNNTGFRNDGSVNYGSQIAKLTNNDKTVFDHDFLNTLDKIKQGDWPCQYGKSVNGKALLELNKLLVFCKMNDINVIAFLPPFADRIYDEMNKSDDYGYMKEIYKIVKPYFNKYNFEFYDFSSVSTCNSNDAETIDGLHGGELTYQKMLISILDAGSILNKVSNVKKLKNDIANKKNNYIVYDY